MPARGAADTAAPGRVSANRYRLDAPIAEGGVGEVWPGTDLALDRRVAVKLLRSEHACDDDGLASALSPCCDKAGFVADSPLSGQL